MDGAEFDNYVAWCSYTQNMTVHQPDEFGFYGCDALSGSRYVSFVNQFSRRTFESICLASGGPESPGYDKTLRKFSDIVTMTCFDLDERVLPAQNSDENIVVRRVAKDDVELDKQPEILPRVTETASPEEKGWYYTRADDPDPARICLRGYDRVVGDVYDIFILTNDDLDFNN